MEKEEFSNLFKQTIIRERIAKVAFDSLITGTYEPPVQASDQVPTLPSLDATSSIQVPTPFQLGELSLLGPEEILDKISDSWKFLSKGTQQTVWTKLLVCVAFKLGFTRSAVALLLCMVSMIGTKSAMHYIKSCTYLYGGSTVIGNKDSMKQMRFLGLLQE